MCTCQHFYGKSWSMKIWQCALCKNRMTIRLLISEMVKDGKLDKEMFKQVCRTFEAGALHALYAMYAC